MLRKVVGSDGDGGKKKTVRAEDAGDVRRRLLDREAGRKMLTRRLAGRMREMRMARLFANGLQYARDRRCEGAEWKRGETRVDNEGGLEVRDKRCRMCTCCTGTASCCIVRKLLRCAVVAARAGEWGTIFGHSRRGGKKCANLRRHCTHDRPTARAKHRRANSAGTTTLPHLRGIRPAP